MSITLLLAISIGVSQVIRNIYKTKRNAISCIPLYERKGRDSNPRYGVACRTTD